MLRFEHEGDGELQTFLRLDGSPAGYVLRDPLRKAKVEGHVHGDQIRVVADREVELGWQIEGPTHGAIDDAVFTRPQ